jgi:hypothetical protein
MVNYRITQTGRNVILRTPHNIETWDIVKNLFLALRELSWAQLSIACRDHDHPAGGDAFIPYMLDRNLIEVL